jgi:biotin carboxyl carrier protein
MTISLWFAGEEFRLKLVQKSKNEFLVSIGKNQHRVFYEVLSAQEILLNIDSRIHTVFIDSNLTSHSVSVNGKTYKLEKKSALQTLGVRDSAQQKKEVKTSMPGKIIKVMVQEGDTVHEGQPVLILEAMKMQNEIKSPRTGQITRIYPESGDSVEAGALLFSVER